MVSSIAASAGNVSILFDQDDEPKDALMLKAPAKVVAGKAFSGEKMLEIPGTTENVQYSAFFKPVPVKPGDKIGFSCLYRTTNKFGTGLIVCIYQDEKGRAVTTENLRILRSADWDRVEHIFTVPDNQKIKQAAVYIRLVKIAKTEKLFLDNLRFGNIEVEKSFRSGALENINFMKWRRDIPAQERFLTGSGGCLLHDWQKAKLGEACILARGNKHPYQYPLTIKGLKITPGINYAFSFNYRTDGPYVSNNGMFIAFFRDAAGKLLKKQSRIRMAASKSWSKREFIFHAPEKAAFVDLRLRLYKQLPEAKIYIDGIDFYKGKPELRLVWSIDPDTKKLSGRAELIAAKAAAPAVVMLKDRAGKVVKNVKAGPKGAFSFNLASLPDQQFNIFAEAVTKEGRLTSPSQGFHNFNKCTWQNDIGILKQDEKPSSPWTPLKYDTASRSVTCWNTVVSFDKYLGIKNIRSLKPDLELFAAPPRLILNGQPIAEQFAPAAITAETISPNKIVLRTVLSSSALDINLTAQVEYDSFIKYTLELKPKSELTVDMLSLQYTPSVMDWQVCYDGSWSNYQLLNLQSGKNFSSKRFYPLLWNGNMESGVYWVAEQLYPAAEIMPKVCQTAQRGQGVSINFVCEPLKITEGKTGTFQYGFGCTPVRPKRAAGKNLRFRAGKKYSNMDLAWSQPTNMKYFGFPEPADPDIFPRYLEDNKDKLLFFYQCPSFAMTGIPQWKYYEEKWISLPLRIYSAKTTMRKWGYDDIKIDQTQKTWTDLYMKHFRQFLTKHKFGGVYYDCMGIYADEKAKEFKFQVFALRDFYSRIYNEQVKRNPDTWFFLHSGATFFTIASIFADITLTGEEYRAKCFDYDYYLQFLTPEDFRMQMCTNTGAWRMFLPQFRNQRSKKPEVAVHTVGLTLVYNLMLYPSFIERKYVDSMQERKFAFIDAGGRDDWQFIPYWKNNPSDNKYVLCSSYLNRKGQLLAAINSTAREQKFKLNLRAKYGEVFVYDPLTDQTVEGTKDTVITLKPYMAKMILVADKPFWTP